MLMLSHFVAYELNGFRDEIIKFSGEYVPFFHLLRSFGVFTQSDVLDPYTSARRSSLAFDLFEQPATRV
jgi:hypothetical protein